MPYFEDVRVGDHLPVLTKHPTTRQLVQWAGASGDYYEVHYDKDFAQSVGLPGVIVHGWLIAAFLGQLVTDWIGTVGEVKKLTCKYRGLMRPGEDVVCKGTVTKKYELEGRHLVECEIWVENARGERTTPGKVVVALPAKS